MEVLKSNYVVDNIEVFSIERVSVGTVLWVLHADKVPPHIGVSIDGRFFSLKANGKDIDVPVQHLLEIVNRRGIALLCFSLNDLLSKEAVRNSFLPYDKTIPNKVTCLNPIKTVLGDSQSGKLVELLASLDKACRIKSVYGLNIPVEFEGIKRYDIAYIHARLSLLNESL